MSNSKGAPNQQPFNVGARRNLTKKNSWWQKSVPENNTQNRKGK